LTAWIQTARFSNVVLEIANESRHRGFDHQLLKDNKGTAELIQLAKSVAPGLLVASSGLGDGTLDDNLAQASDFFVGSFQFRHSSRTYRARIAALRKYGKPIVCNEDAKVNEAGAAAAEICVTNGAFLGIDGRTRQSIVPFQVPRRSR
jgi:hypothetical protein